MIEYDWRDATPFQYECTQIKECWLDFNFTNLIILQAFAILNNPTDEFDIEINLNREKF